MLLTSSPLGSLTSQLAVILCKVVPIESIIKLEALGEFGPGPEKTIGASCEFTVIVSEPPELEALEFDFFIFFFSIIVS